MRATGQAISLIKKFEGCELSSYEDSHGRWAIGYGTTGKGISPGLKITQHEAERLLANRVSTLQEDVTDLVRVKLTQAQFDALMSFVYNVGIGAFSTSSLLRLLNNQDYHEAARELLKWTHSSGKELPGLKARRVEEYSLFNS